MTTKKSQVPIPEAVVAALDRARRRRGAMSECATDTGIHRQTLSKVVNRQQTRMTAETLTKLARWLDVELVEDEVPRQWVLPADFDVVPNHEREAAVSWLRWALNTRARVTRGDPGTGG